MSDWHELDELIRKREESEKHRRSLQNEKEDDEKQRQIAFQKEVLLSQPRFVELLSYWDKIVTKYLMRIGKETWNGWQGSISKSLYGSEPTDDKIKEAIANQLYGKESSIFWRAEFSRCNYSVEVEVKDFKPTKIVVRGKNQHGAEAVNEYELKKALLAAFQDGPQCHPENIWEGWSLN